MKLSWHQQPVSGIHKLAVAALQLCVQPPNLPIAVFSPMIKSAASRDIFMAEACEILRLLLSFFYGNCAQDPVSSPHHAAVGRHADGSQDIQGH